jgi:hypothetical protein
MDRDFNAFEAMKQWSEKDKTPDKIIYSHREAGKGAAWTTNVGKVNLTWPVCTYPKVSRYKGNGGINDAVNFTCVDPGKWRRQWAPEPDLAPALLEAFGLAGAMKVAAFGAGSRLSNQ